MYHSIPGNTQYRINSEGKVIDNNDKECHLPTTDDKVSIELYGVLRHVYLNWLALYAEYEINLPASLQHRIHDIWFNEEIMIGDKPVKDRMCFLKPMHINNEYRLIPNYSYAASIDGRIINVSTGELCKEHVALNGYYRISVWSPKDKVIWHLNPHRCVALAWVRNTNIYKYNVVNHKDGNKLNNHATNLEWTDDRGNAAHARNMGLYTDNTRCKVRDVLTKEVIDFYSATEACTFMGIARQSIEFLSTKLPGKLYNNKYEFKVATDDTPWYYETNAYREVNGKYNVVVTKPDGTTQTYYDKETFIKELQLWTSNSHSMKDAMVRAKSLYPDYTFELASFAPTKTIQVIDIETKEITEFKSVRELCRTLPLNFSSVLVVLNKGEQYVYDKYAFRHTTDTEWDTNFIMPKSVGKKIIATHSVTKQVMEFNSVTTASKHFKVERRSIVNRVEKGLLLDGWLLIEK